MHIERCLFGSQFFSLVSFEHAPHAGHCADGDEKCSAYAVNFVEAGTFGLGVNDQTWQLTSGSVFLSEPGVVHRYHHFASIPSDVCLSARYSAPFIEAERELRPEIFERAASTVPASNRLAFLRFQLGGLLNSRDPLAIETWGCDLFNAARASAPSTSKLYRSRQLAWYADRIATARNRLEREFCEPHSLISLARSVGMSTFQFARVFHELIGLPPHRYLICRRLEHAVEMLRAGRPVTAACFGSGFMNLSHFIRSFQRRFGCRPSTVRKRNVISSIRPFAVNRF